MNSFLDVQSDWNTNNSFWISGFQKPILVGESNVDVHYEKRGLSCDVNTAAGCDKDQCYYIHEKDETSITLFSAQYNYRCEYHIPVETYDCQSQLYSISVSPNGNYMCVGGANGYCALKYVHNESPKDHEAQLEGHYGDVLSTQFFPSSKVILTGSSDFRLRIYCVETGKCAAILNSHTSRISNTAIIDKGRNILSCSQDGTTILWNCGTSSPITKWNLNSPINRCCLFEDPSNDLIPECTEDRDDIECGTNNKVVVCATNKGICGIDIRARKEIFSIETTDPVNCCIAHISPTPAMVTGTNNGVLQGWDLRNLSSSLYRCSRTQAGISKIVSHQNSKNDVWVSSNDGCCSLWRNAFYNSEICQELPHVDKELTNLNYEPIRDFSMYSSAKHVNIYSVCRDGVIRKYSIGKSQFL